MTKSLQLIDPTLVAFVRSLEIVAAYLVQILWMAENPAPSSVWGSSLVILSVIMIGFEEKFVAYIPNKIKHLF